MNSIKTDKDIMDFDMPVSDKKNLTMNIAAPKYPVELDSHFLTGRISQLELEKTDILERLQEIQSKYYALVNQIPSITYIASVERQGKLLFVSPQIDKLGFAPKDWLEDEQGLFKHIYKDDLFEVINDFERVSKNQTPLNCEYRIIDKNGRIRWLRNEANVIRDENNKAVFLQGTLTDITKDKENEQELSYYRQRLGYLVSQRTQQIELQNSILKSANHNLVDALGGVYHENSVLRTEKAHFQGLLDTVGEGIISIDCEGFCHYANDAALDILGYTKDDLLGQNLSALLYADGPGNTLLNPVIPYENNSDLMGNEFPQLCTGLLRHKISGTVAVEYSIYPAQEDARITSAVLVFREISMSLRYQATHDSLTGVSNRREFVRHAAQVLASTHKDNAEHTLCYLDFDHFKLVNDTYGHAAGDELLRALMALVKSKLRPRDCIGRLGGDEFALLLEHSTLNQALSFVKGLAKSVNEYRFNWKGKSVSVSVSIGLASLNRVANNITEVINAADQACLQSKEKGRNQAIVWQ